MSSLLRSELTIALDKVCESAEICAGVYGDLAELVVDDDVAAQLRECASARAQAANDLIVARQDAGELPAGGDPERAALQALGMKLESLVSDTDAMFRSLRDLDLDVREAADHALSQVQQSGVASALNALVATIDEVRPEQLG